MKVGWGVTVAATIWSLCLNRNLILFERKVLAVDEVLLLVKIREFSWCQASNLLSKTEVGH